MHFVHQWPSLVYLSDPEAGVSEQAREFVGQVIRLEQMKPSAAWRAEFLESACRVVPREVLWIQAMRLQVVWLQVAYVIQVCWRNLPTWQSK